MIIDDVDYDDEEEWRVARVVSAKVVGEEHRIQTNHHGGMIRTHYVCQDCKSVYFDQNSKVEESPVVVHGTIPVNDRLIDLLVELAVYHADELLPMQKFIEKLVKDYELVYKVPDLEDLRAKTFLENEDGGPSITV